MVIRFSMITVLLGLGLLTTNPTNTMQMQELSPLARSIITGIVAGVSATLGVLILHVLENGATEPCRTLCTNPPSSSAQRQGDFQLSASDREGFSLEEEEKHG